MTTIEKAREANRIKAQIIESLILKGYTKEEIGQILADYPKLIANLECTKPLPKWFRDAIVCWYNPKKQGVKNGVDIVEGKPWTLKDFSGNGLDMTMYNFAGEGMSGMDGYTNFEDGDVGNTFSKIGEQSWIYTNIQDDRLIGKPASNLNYKSVIKVKISGLLDNESIQVRGNDGLILSNGSYEIDLSQNTLIGTLSWIFFAMVGKSQSNDRNIKIEILPKYEGALVFDGVDDYGMSENQPILTDYTVMAKRINPTTEDDVNAFMSKRNAFIIEYRKANMYSFGAENYIQSKYTDNDFVIQTATTYNNRPINKGSESDGTTLNTGYTTSALPFKGALYDFLLFNRTLTPDEIDWVKYNIMGEELPKPIAIWDAKGRRNDEPEAIRNILLDRTGNGHNITLHNFGWVEGSGYKDDALVFDGTDDYGICDNMPIFTKEKGYTVIAKKKNFATKPYSYFLSKEKAFNFEAIRDDFSSIYTLSFGSGTRINHLPKDIVFQTSKSYNGYEINKGEFEDSENSLKISNTGWKGAFYQLHIFDHDLTPSAIEAYIRRYIDPKYQLPE